MAIKVSLDIIFSYFLTGKKPNQSQFQNTFFSLRHKDDPIEIGEVTNLQNQLNTLFANQQTGIIPNSETLIAVGDFEKAFPVGKHLISVLIDPPGQGDYSLNIGLTPFGTEIVDAFTIDAEAPEEFQYSKYFKTAATWYFTNVPANSTVTFYYK